MLGEQCLAGSAPARRAQQWAHGTEATVAHKGRRLPVPDLFDSGPFCHHSRVRVLNGCALCTEATQGQRPALVPPLPQPTVQTAQRQFPAVGTRHAGHTRAALDASRGADSDPGATTERVPAGGRGISRAPAPAEAGPPRQYRWQAARCRGVKGRVHRASVTKASPPTEASAKRQGCHIASPGGPRGAPCSGPGQPRRAQRLRAAWGPGVGGNGLMRVEAVGARRRAGMRRIHSPPGPTPPRAARLAGHWCAAAGDGRAPRLMARMAAAGAAGAQLEASKPVLRAAGGSDPVRVRCDCLANLMARLGNSCKADSRTRRRQRASTQRSAAPGSFPSRETARADRSGSRARPRRAAPAAGGSPAAMSCVGCRAFSGQGRPGISHQS